LVRPLLKSLPRKRGEERTSSPAEEGWRRVMKLNKKVALAAALVAGSLAVMACSKASDEDVVSGAAETEQATAMDQGSTNANEGIEQDARWGHGFRHAGWRRGDRDRDDRGWGWRRWGGRRGDGDRDDWRRRWHRWW
jgi:hypothetical protein